MEQTERETIVYKGKKYHRYPNSKRRQHREYYYRHDKWGEPPFPLHRQIYLDFNGEIPEGYHIHHIDGDTSNNSPDNLEAISPTEHRKRHPASEETKEKFRENAKKNDNLGKWRKENPEKARECAIANGKKNTSLADWKKNNPEKASKIYSEAAKKSREAYKRNKEARAASL